MTEQALHFVHRGLRCIFGSALESGHLLGSTFGNWHSTNHKGDIAMYDKNVDNL